MLPSDGIGKRIGRYRRIAGLSARELAEQAGRGLTRGIIANLESERKTDITVDQLLAIAVTLGVPPLVLALPVEAPFRVVELANGTRPQAAPVWVAAEWFRDENLAKFAMETPAAPVARTTLRMTADYVQRVRDLANGEGAPDEIARAATELRERADELVAVGVDVAIERADGSLIRASDAVPMDVTRLWFRMKVGEHDGEHPAEA
ncbi:helix-turn-helix transcriptional regulator [Microbacterium sp. NPDC064584]|uniref:helix-turn-helix domain-containing protein n=1 Tax=Microbacterium sp. NPDC064584 TaxID=3155817 RepID=UPI0034373EA8